MSLIAYPNALKYREQATDPWSTATIFAKADLESLADKFDTTETYTEGEIVLYQGGMYKCKAGGAGPGAWDATEWDQTTVEAELAALQTEVDSVKNTLNSEIATRQTYVRPNLLDNWYFINPVNQRGQTSYSNAGYTIDRWKLTSGSVEVVSGGITLNGTLVQILEHSIGQSVTASALLSDGTMITPAYDDTTKTCMLTATGQTIKAVKLELGSGQTLAHLENGLWVLNDIPNYADEFARCQRYFFNLNSWNNQYATVGFAYAAGSDNINVIVSFPVTMRNAGFSQSYKDTIVFQVGSTYKYATSPRIAVYNRSAGSMQVNISGFSGLTTGSYGICYLGNYGTITFSVDL